MMSPLPGILPMRQGTVETNHLPGKKYFSFIQNGEFRRFERKKSFHSCVTINNFRGFF